MSERPDDLSIVAVDTGGTFTDVVCSAGGELRILKLPSSPDDPARAVLEGIRLLVTSDSGSGSGSANRGAGPGSEIRERGNSAAKPGASETGAAPRTAEVVPAPRAADPDPESDFSHPTPDHPPFLLIHGSTVATNALLERRGARVALVTNRGFEDVIEIGRQNRPQLYALVGTRPPPIVSRDDRHGIAGRIGPDGAEEEPLNDAELAGLAALVEDAEAVAVCLLHSYADPGHERRVAAALEKLGVPLSVSSELLPEFREYERTATTVVNAYVAPRMDRYLGRIEADAGAERIRIMGSGGGAIPVARARRDAVHTVLSGPAGGVMGALRVAELAGIRDIITFDMGGTSTDVSLCPGRPLHTREFSIAGLPVAVPVIDIHTVGAGGGSLARLDAGGALRVGPESAGADPGPIAYGRGGTGVTVTDAHVRLGRLPAEAFLGGDLRLDRDRIEGPLRALAERLGTDPDTAAEGVLAVADTSMEAALRVISVERGFDPADFTLVPFGGAAALHAVELAERLGIPRLLVPPNPGVLSAFGMLASPVRKDTSRTVLLGADDAAPDRLDSEFAALETDAVAAMAEEGIAAGRLELRRWVDARYRGQSYELRVPADAAWIDSFHAAHEARYGYARREAAVEAVTLRLEATAPVVPPALPRLPAAPTPEPPAAVTVHVVFRGARLRAARYPRESLLAGHRFEGPAIVTEYSATTWLPPGCQAEVHESGSLVLTRI